MARSQAAARRDSPVRMVRVQDMQGVNVMRKPAAYTPDEAELIRLIRQKERDLKSLKHDLQMLRESTPYKKRPDVGSWTLGVNLMSDDGK